MRKIVMIAILVALAATLAFAESFTVQAVNGRVDRDSGRVEIKPGDTLDGEMVIKTGIGASIVLKDGAEKTITIPANREGKVEELAKAASGVRIGGTVVRTDNSALSRTTGQVGTASARASDQAGEVNIAAE